MPNLIEITEFSAPELDVYARLSEVQLRSRQDPSQALFIAESPLVIGRALDAGCVPVSALMDGSHVSAAARKFWPGSVRTCPFSRRRMPCSRS